MVQMTIFCHKRQLDSRAVIVYLVGLTNRTLTRDLALTYHMPTRDNDRTVAANNSYTGQK